MAYRVLIVGGRGWRDYGKLRSALDAILVNRLPDVAILTAGGPGAPALAACYARSRGLELVALVPDHERYPGCAVQRRNVRLAEEADAAVVVGDDTRAVVLELVARVRASGRRVLVVTERERSAEPVESVDEVPRTRGLPD